MTMTEERRQEPNYWRLLPGAKMSLIVLLATQTHTGTVWAAGIQSEWGMVAQPNMLLNSLKMIGSLALVLGLMLLSLYGLKRWWGRGGRRPSGSQIQVLDVRMLAPKKSVALVEVAGERLLLGVGVDSVGLLTRIESPGHQLESAADRCRFAENLVKALRDQTADQETEGRQHTGEKTTAERDSVPGPEMNSVQSRQGDAVKKRLTMLK